jgi:hypothetical protein
MTNDLDEILLALLGSKELVDAWWNSPNQHFKLDTPQQAWNTDPKAVAAYILGTYYR